MKNVEQLDLFDFNHSVEVRAVVPERPELSFDQSDGVDSLRSISIYTDGACSGNPGPGGCAAIVAEGTDKKELYRGYKRTTNNRMEMMALVIALETIEQQAVLTIYSDSKYLINSFDKGWLRNWKRSGWMTKGRKPVKNVDLWKRLDSLLAIHQSTFVWVKGHSEHPENTRCDELAVTAKTGKILLHDECFE